MTAAALSGTLRTLLAQVVETRTGIHYSERDLDLFSEKVAARASEAGFESLLDYYYLLRYADPGDVELDQLVDVLVVGETYFFREADALQALVDTLGHSSPTGERMRIWCAACATGEEAVTLAILLERAGLSSKVDIVATDISDRSLARARKGEYGVQAHRAIPQGLEPWIRISNGRAQVAERIRTAIDWRRVNLVDSGSIAGLGSFDAILCRNVLIYFADETVRKVADSLSRALRPGGRLLVGTSESLMRFGTAFAVAERAGAFFYKRGPG